MKSKAAFKFLGKKSEMSLFYYFWVCDQVYPACMKQKRPTKLFLIGLLATAIAGAAPPFGIWKLNPAKSQFEPGQAPSRAGKAEHRSDHRGNGRQGDRKKRSVISGNVMTNTSDGVDVSGKPTTLSRCLRNNNRRLSRTAATESSP
jgi:hypothetical protein